MSFRSGHLAAAVNGGNGRFVSFGYRVLSAVIAVMNG